MIFKCTACLNSVHYRVLFGLHCITNCYNKLHGTCSDRLSKSKCLPTGCKHRPLKKWLQSLFCTCKQKQLLSDAICKRVGEWNRPQKCSFFLLCKWCGKSVWWCPLFNSYFIFWSRFLYREHEMRKFYIIQNL